MAPCSWYFKTDERKRKKDDKREEKVKEKLKMRNLVGDVRNEKKRTEILFVLLFVFGINDRSGEFPRETCVAKTLIVFQLQLMKAAFCSSRCTADYCVFWLH